MGFLRVYKMSNIFIFDLDETCISSSHRTPSFPDGTLNLPEYRKNATPENIAKDTLLPLAATLQKLISEKSQVIILTARDMSAADYFYLGRHGLATEQTLICSRDKALSKAHYNSGDGLYKAAWIEFLRKNHGLELHHVIMFDDAKPVKSTLRAMGLTVLCGHKVNKRLSRKLKNGNL